KISLAETGAAAVGVVSVEMACAVGVEVNQIGDRRALAAHRLDIEMQNEIRVRQAGEGGDGFRAGIYKIRLRRGERFQTEFDAAFGDSWQSAGKGIKREIRSLFARLSGRDAALAGRAKNHQVAAQIPARAGQLH